MMKKQKRSSFDLKKYLFVQIWCALFAIKIMSEKAEKGSFGYQKSCEMTTSVSGKVEK